MSAEHMKYVNLAMRLRERAGLITRNGLIREIRFLMEEAADAIDVLLDADLARSGDRHLRLAGACTHAQSICAECARRCGCVYCREGLGA